MFFSLDIKQGIGFDGKIAVQSEQWEKNIMKWTGKFGSDLEVERGTLP